MRHGLKLLGLCMLAALSLMALSAAAAQAEDLGGEFRIGSPLKTFKEAGVASKEIAGTVLEGELLEEGDIKIHCSGGTGSGTVFQGGAAKAHVLFNECKILNQKFCTVYEDLGTPGNISTLLGAEHILASGEGHLLLHENKHYLLAEGLEKGTKPFAMFDVYGPLCPLDEGEEPQLVSITGSQVVELPGPLTDTVEGKEVKLPGPLEDAVTHLVQSLTLEVSHKLFPNDKLFIGANEAHFGNGTGPNGVVQAHVHLVSEEIWGSE